LKRELNTVLYDTFWELRKQQKIPRVKIFGVFEGQNFDCVEILAQEKFAEFGINVYPKIFLAARTICK